MGLKETSCGDGLFVPKSLSQAHDPKGALSLLPTSRRRNGRNVHDQFLVRTIQSWELR